MTIKRNCFAYKEDNIKHQCNCLKELNCKNCPFYKEKDKIKNNIFYEYSFKNKDEFVEAIERYYFRFGIGHLEDFEDED